MSGWAEYLCNLSCCLKIVLLLKFGEFCGSVFDSIYSPEIIRRLNLNFYCYAAGRKNQIIHQLLAHRNKYKICPQVTNKQSNENSRRASVCAIKIPSSCKSSEN